jgi:transcriptional regulator with XRE-family HTH domain
VKSGLTLRALGSRLGLSASGGASYLVRLEKGKLHNVRLATIVGYLKACNEPAGRFFLDLFPDPQITQISQIGIQHKGHQGEADIGNWKLEIGNCKLNDQELKTRNEEPGERAGMMRRMRKQARRERMSNLLAEIQPIVEPYLVGGQTFRLDAYVKAANDMLRIGKKIMARAGSSGKAEALKAEFDRIERENPSWYLDPEALRLVREMIENKLRG